MSLIFQEHSIVISYKNLKEHNFWLNFQSNSLQSIFFKQLYFAIINKTKMNVLIGIFHGIFMNNSVLFVKTTFPFSPSTWSSHHTFLSFFDVHAIRLYHTIVSQDS